MPRTGRPRKYASKAEKAQHDVIAGLKRRKNKAFARNRTLVRIIAAGFRARRLQWVERVRLVAKRIPKLPG